MQHQRGLRARQRRREASMARRSGSTSVKRPDVNRRQRRGSDHAADVGRSPRMLARRTVTELDELDACVTAASSAALHDGHGPRGGAGVRPQAHALAATASRLPVDAADDFERQQRMAQEHAQQRAIGQRAALAGQARRPASARLGPSRVIATATRSSGRVTRNVGHRHVHERRDVERLWRSSAAPRRDAWPRPGSDSCGARRTCC